MNGFELPQATSEIIILIIFLTALITSLATRIGETIIIVITKPFTFLYEKIYIWLAPRNPFSLSLRSYKKHILRSNLARIENPVGPEIQIPLERAFAPLRLISSADREGVELFEYTAEHDRFLLLGGPGTGKTTLMKNLLVNILKGTCHPKLNQLVPVYIRLKSLATKQHTVDQAVISAFAEYHFPGADKFVRSSIDKGKLLIILDGLDEVGVNRAFVTLKIREFCQKDDQQEKKNWVIVTCREYSYKIQDLRDIISALVRVEPFSNHHMRTFLQGWPLYRNLVALRLYPLIQADPQIRDVCRNPLLLTILIGLYLETGEEKFRIPATREKFYASCLDELIANRPARKSINQEFQREDKQQILEMSALETLETANRLQDPEELTTEVLNKHASKIISEKIDIRKLIKELVEIDGILRPTGENSYTFLHRTFQEYFAARECHRTRTLDQVLHHFGQRQEMAEVLHFYCGLIRNVPQLRQITEHFIKKGEWERAAKCVINMVGNPDEDLIHEISKMLYETIEKESSYHSELETLSSLAQRTDRPFEPARLFFSRTVNLLTDKIQTSGTSSLEFALASNPAIAIKIIPALRIHGSPAARRLVVRVLKDLGTEEALDELFEIIQGTEGVEKFEAAKVITDLISNRKKDLIQRQTLLPLRQDHTIWPLEKYFPARIAIPLAEALAKEAAYSPIIQEPHNAAMKLAVQAILQRQEIFRRDNAFLKQWGNLARDLNLLHYRQVFGAWIRGLLIALSLTIVSATLAAGLLSLITHRILIIKSQPIEIQSTVVDFFEQVQIEAERVVVEIKNSYPPNARGISRILPWNWSVEPVLPNNLQEYYDVVKGMANRRTNIITLSQEEKNKFILNASVQGKLELVKALNTFDSHTSDILKQGLALIIRPPKTWDFIEVLIALIYPTSFVLYFIELMRSRIRIKRYFLHRSGKTPKMYMLEMHEIHSPWYKLTVFFAWYSLILIYISTWVLVPVGITHLFLLSTGVFLISLVFSFLLSSKSKWWPNNQYFYAVDSLVIPD